MKKWKGEDMNGEEGEKDQIEEDAAQTDEAYHSQIIAWKKVRYFL